MLYLLMSYFLTFICLSKRLLVSYILYRSYFLHPPWIQCIAFVHAIHLSVNDIVYCLVYICLACSNLVISTAMFSSAVNNAMPDRINPSDRWKYDIYIITNPANFLLYMLMIFVYRNPPVVYIYIYIYILMQTLSNTIFFIEACIFKALCWYECSTIQHIIL